jgi:putative CocE/NonD family hydrolase
MFATLYVSSNAIDTDFMVRISDVYPNGEAHLIEDGAFRMRWRDGTSKPLFMNKDIIYEIKFPIGNTSYIFASGHSIRYVIQSSNYPRYSINKNNGILLKDIDQGDNITAVNTVFFSNEYPSHITLPFVEKHQLPVLHNIKEMLQESYPSLDMDKIISDYPNGIFK